MKITVTANGRTLDDQVDPRFGRCPYFVIVDTDTMSTEAIENPNLGLGGGAGIQSAQLMAQHDVEVVLTGSCGPNAYQTLNAAEIRVMVGAGGRVRDAVDQLRSGALSSSRGPNVASHFGMSMGGGGGMGRGMGIGGGMGGGGGTGGGMGRGAGMAAGSPQVPPEDEEVSSLKAEAERLRCRLKDVGTAAEIDASKCTGCGLCIGECPQGALTLSKA